MARTKKNANIMVKRSQTDKALEIVRSYQPPLYLKERIHKENSGDATI